MFAMVWKPQSCMLVLFLALLLTANFLAHFYNEYTADIAPAGAALVSTDDKNQEQHVNGELVYKEEESCDIFDGRWVVDESAPRYYSPGSCPAVDRSFDCFNNGRPDSNYTRWRWQPRHCNLPRIAGKKMLEVLRGKRLAFVGDSLNRNMWESLVCILRGALPDKRRAYEIRGRKEKEFKAENSLAFVFSDYNCSIEFFQSRFLVEDSKVVAGPNGTAAADRLRLDLMKSSSRLYEDADVVVFNTGHWWTHEKTSQGKDYYQEGSHVYSRLSAEEALAKAMRTWARWVETHVDASMTRVFFRGYSSSHFSGGKWNEGGNCHGETLPVVEDAQLVTPRRKLGRVVESALGEMKSPVVYLNVTRMTDYRKDAHPSVYRVPLEGRSSTAVQDCSHWCLPGVPDVWNEMLYSILMREAKMRNCEEAEACTFL